VARKRKTWRFRLDDTTVLEVSAKAPVTEKQVRRRGRVSLIIGTLVAALTLVAVAYADQVQVDGDTATNGNNVSYKATPGAGDEACSTRGTAVAGRVSINYQGNTHYNPSSTVTVTVTPNANALAAGITATGGTATVPSGWAGTNTSGSSSFTVAISTTVPTTAANATGSTYTMTVKASGAATQYTGSGTSAVDPFEPTGSYTVSIDCPAAPTDTTAPENASISIDNGATYTNSSTPSVVLDIAGTDNVGITKYRLATSQAGLATASDVSVAATTSLSIDDLAHNPAWSSEGSNSVWVRLYDATGNSADASDSIFWDKTKPINAITGVSNGATYTLGSAPAAGCTTTDPGADATPATGSGVATTATVNVTGGTVNGVGSFTATCSGGSDNAGNTANAASVSYTVWYGGVSGILQPINPDNSSVFNRGKAVPVKFQLAGDAFTGFNFSGWTLKQQQTACTIDGDPVGGEIEPVVENPSNGFRYDSTADQYIYNANFKDKAVGTCWKVIVTLDSGQKLESAVFKLQK